MTEVVELYNLFYVGETDKFIKYVRRETSIEYYFMDVPTNGKTFMDSFKDFK